MEPTRVGIREFRAGLAEFIASETPVAVTRHGLTVGYFIPVQAHIEHDLAALRKASADLDRLLEAKAVDTEQVAAEFRARRKAASAAGKTRRR